MTGDLLGRHITLSVAETRKVRFVRDLLKVMDDNKVAGAKESLAGLETVGKGVEFTEAKKDAAKQ
jgi:hypothetical protein